MIRALLLLAAFASPLSAVKGDELATLRARAAAAAVNLIVKPVAAMPAAIEWVSEREAFRSGKRIWLFITDGPHCRHCVTSAGLQRDPAFIAAAGKLACVKLDWSNPADRARIRAYGETSFPVDRICPPGGATCDRYEGAPRDVTEYINRLNGTGKAGASG